MKKFSLALVFGLFMVGMFFTSSSLAAARLPPSQAQAGHSPSALITPTETVTQPVAAALANHFGVPYEEIAALHDAGLGFGVIARAYFLAERFEDVTPQALLAEFQAGRGWGQIVRQLGLHPGRHGQGGSMGDVMSAQAQSRANGAAPENQTESDEPSQPGQGHGRANAPGQNKDKTTPGQGHAGQDQESGE
jgi:hypothetical protein